MKRHIGIQVRNRYKKLDLSRPKEDNAIRSKRFNLRMAMGLLNDEDIAVGSTARVILSHSRRMVWQPEFLSVILQRKPCCAFRA